MTKAYRDFSEMPDSVLKTFAVEWTRRCEAKATKRRLPAVCANSRCRSRRHIYGSCPKCGSYSIKKMVKS